MPPGAACVESPLPAGEGIFRAGSKPLSNWPEIVETLTEGAKLLIEHPAIGKRVEGRDDRELPIPFGQRGYVLRYRQDGQTVAVLRVWHSLEKREDQ